MTFDEIHFCTFLKKPVARNNTKGTFRYIVLKMPVLVQTQVENKAYNIFNKTNEKQLNPGTCTNKNTKKIRYIIRDKRSIIRRE